MTPHEGYIAAAYGFTALVLLAVIGWSIAQFRIQRRALAEIETRLGRRD